MNVNYGQLFMNAFGAFLTGFAAGYAMDSSSLKPGIIMGLTALAGNQSGLHQAKPITANGGPAVTPPGLKSWVVALLVAGSLLIAVSGPVWAQASGVPIVTPVPTPAAAIVSATPPAATFQSHWFEAKLPFMSSGYIHSFGKGPGDSQGQPVFINFEAYGLTRPLTTVDPATSKVTIVQSPILSTGFNVGTSALNGQATTGGWGVPAGLYLEGMGLIEANIGGDLKNLTGKTTDPVTGVTTRNKPGYWGFTFNLSTAASYGWKAITGSP